MAKIEKKLHAVLALLAGGRSDRAKAARTRRALHDLWDMLVDLAVRDLDAAADVQQARNRLREGDVHGALRRVRSAARVLAVLR